MPPSPFPVSPHLQEDACGPRGAHGPVAVGGRAPVHARRVLVDGRHGQRPLRGHGPPWVLRKEAQKSMVV
jgi:hypothetical protein